MVQLAFNAEATKLGGKVTSIDPIYQFSATEIMKRFYEVVDNIIDQVKLQPVMWSYHKSPEDLRTIEFEPSMNSLTIMTRESKKEGIALEDKPSIQKKQVRYSLMLTLLFLYLSIMIISFITTN